MKKTISLAAMALALSASAILPAQAGPAPLIIWVGAVELLNVTTACNVPFPGMKAKAGNQSEPMSVFRPRLDPTSEPPTSLNFFYSPFGGYVVFRWASGDDQLHGTGNLTGIGIYKDLSNPVFPPTGFTSSYSFKITPATIVSTTKTIFISGIISNYGGIAGCNVTFEGTYLQQR